MDNFGPSKTVAVLFFHRRISLERVTKVMIEGVEIPFLPGAKYLAVYLDHRLNFKEHVEQNCKKAMDLFISDSKKSLNNVLEILGSIKSHIPPLE